MWSRWKAGQSLHQIGRAFGKSHVSIQFLLSQHGGIIPATRRRSLLTLTLAEREGISRGSLAVRRFVRYRVRLPHASAKSLIACVGVEPGSRNPPNPNSQTEAVSLDSFVATDPVRLLS